MFAPPCPTHLSGASGNSSFKNLKSKSSLGKGFFDNMHKPRLSLNLNNIIQKEKAKNKIMEKSFTKFALLSLMFHFSDTFFPKFSGTLLRKNKTVQGIPYLSWKHKEEV